MLAEAVIKGVPVVEGAVPLPGVVKALLGNVHLAKVCDPVQLAVVVFAANTELPVTPVSIELTSTLEVILLNVPSALTFTFTVKVQVLSPELAMFPVYVIEVAPAEGENAERH